MPELDPELLPVFASGERITLQRTVRGKNVLMFVEARYPCSLDPKTGLMKLKADIRRAGVSSFADGRVAAQSDAITRLLERLHEAAGIIAAARWNVDDKDEEAASEYAAKWLREYAEGRAIALTEKVAPEETSR